MPNPFNRTRPSGAAGDRRFRVTMRFTHNGYVNPVTGWGEVRKSTLVPPTGQSTFNTDLRNALTSQFGTGNPTSGGYMSLGASSNDVGSRGSSGHAIVFDIVDDIVNGVSRFGNPPSTLDRTYIAQRAARAFASAMKTNTNGADLVAAATSGGSSGPFRFDGLQATFTPRVGSTPTPAPPPAPAPSPTPTPTPAPPPAPAPIVPADQRTPRPVAPAPAPPPAAATESQRAAARELATFVAAAAPGLLVNASSRAVFNSTVERLQRALGGVRVDGLYGNETRTRMEALGVSAPAARPPSSGPARPVTQNDQRVVGPAQANIFGGRLSGGVVAAVVFGVLAIGGAVAYATSGPSDRAPALPARSSRPAARRSGR